MVSDVPARVQSPSLETGPLSVTKQQVRRNWAEGPHTLSAVSCCLTIPAFDFPRSPLKNENSSGVKMRVFQDHPLFYKGQCMSVQKGSAGWPITHRAGAGPKLFPRPRADFPLQRPPLPSSYILTSLAELFTGSLKILTYPCIVHL